MANRFPLIFNSGAGQIQELAASDNLDLTSSNLVNAGILFTSSGSQTAPSISIGNGTTYPPGLYSPGTDQLAVATNGVERLKFGTAEVVFNDGGENYDFRVEGVTSSHLLFVDASTNRVCIGNAISAPQRTLHVNTGSDTYVRISGDRGEAADLHIGNIEFENTFNSQGVIAEIRAITGSSSTYSSKGQLAFYTDDGSSYGERARIDSSGRLGIGTGSPDTHLHLYASNNSASIRFTNTAALKVWELNPSIPNVANSGFSLYNVTDSTVPLHVTNAGLVGIGTASPGYSLDIASADTTAGNALRLRQNATAAAAGLQFTDAGATTQHGAIVSDTSSNLKFATGNTEKLRITSTGTLNFKGAGTAGSTQAVSFDGSAPVNSLVIDSSGRLCIGSSSPTNSANLDIQLDTVSATDTYAKLQIRSGNYGYIIKGGLKQGAGAQLHFDMNNNGSVSTKMVLDTEGRLGINTTSPSTALQVNGTVTATTFQSTSDINLKENIKTVNNSLNIVSQLRGVTFDWKNTHQASIGVIAQEVEQILPELVSGGEIKTVNYNGIIGILVEAIKEQEVRIEKLENKLNAQ